MKKSKLKQILIYVILFVAFILIFGLALSCNGCETSTKEVSKIEKEGTAGEEKPESEEALGLSEQPDKELFDKYFRCIQLGKSALLPHQETWLGVEFKNKKNFIFRIAVLNLETNDFVERCATTASVGGSDGFVMEALEWAFLRPGSYEYRIYVEDKLAAALPFEVISYFKMPPAYILGFLLDIVLNPLVWVLIIFWSIYAKTKKRWAKITAIVFSCIAPLAILVSCFGNCIVTEILLGYWF
ncbi:hypothetical protein ES707_04585 [subsurface metagenome]